MSTDIASPQGNAADSGRNWRIPFSPEFLRFLVVGTVAFVIAEAALFLLYDVLPLLPSDRSVSIGPFTHPDISLLISSVVAVEMAIIFKFYANEHWTFPDRPKPEAAFVRFAKFNASAVLSPIITVATVNILTPVFGISPYISVAVGTLLGFLVNWYFSAYHIWRHRHHESPDTA